MTDEMDATVQAVADGIDRAVEEKIRAADQRAERWMQRALRAEGVVADVRRALGVEDPVPVERPVRCLNTAECRYEEPHDHGFACSAECPCGESMQASRAQAVAPEPVAYEVSMRATGQHLGALCISPGEAENLSEVYELIPLYRHPARKIDRESLRQALTKAHARMSCHEPDAYGVYADAVIAHLEGGAA